MLWEIDWGLVQRMLIDAPREKEKKKTDSENSDAKSSDFNVTMNEDNIEDIMKHLEKYK